MISAQYTEDGRRNSWACPVVFPDVLSLRISQTLSQIHRLSGKSFPCCQHLGQNLWGKKYIVSRLPALTFWKSWNFRGGCQGWLQWRVGGGLKRNNHGYQYLNFCSALDARPLESSFNLSTTLWIKYHLTVVENWLAPGHLSHRTVVWI